MRGKTITIHMSRGRVAQTGNLFQYDYGQKLVIAGVELPTAYEVHFSNTDIGNSKTQIGDSTGVTIPDEYLLSGEKIHVWIYLHDGESDGETEYHGIINVTKRAKPTDQAPTPVQQSVIDQAIAALNAGVTEVEGIAEGIPQTIDTALSEAKASGEFDGKDGKDGKDGADGFSPTASVSKSGNKSTISITDKNGTTTAEVTDGQDGATGATPVISIGTVSKLSPGSNPTASMDTTDPEHPVLSLGLVTGDPGDPTLLIDNTSTALDKTWSSSKVSSDLAPKANPVFTGSISMGRKADTTVGEESVAVGHDATASERASHAEGGYTTASGEASHAEGGNTTASGALSHAEGGNTTASESYSHAEGFTTTASGVNSHAEGNQTVASGITSHSEGNYTVAAGADSHVGGRLNTVDSYDNWTEWTANTAYVVGDKRKVTTTSNDVTTITGYICNTAHTSGSSFDASKWTNQYGKMNYAEIIGNGTAIDARSNARALDWDGNERLMGDVYVGCNSDSTGGTKLAKVTDIPDPTSIIDDSAGDGVTNKTWSADKLTDLNTAIESNASDITDLQKSKAPVILDTASGAIASFPDGADGLPIESLVVGIEPVQDLHGQDAPYPPGGGKNLLNANISNNYMSLSNGVYTVTTVPLSNSSGNLGTVSLKGGESYILSGGYSQALRLVVSVEGTNYLSGSGESNVITPSENVTVNVSYVIETTATVGWKIYPMVRKSTDSSGWQPYSNICPISGWTGANVTKTGKNLLLLSTDDIDNTQRATTTASNGSASVTATGTYGRTMFHKKVTAGYTYTFSFKAISTGNYNQFIIRNTNNWSSSGSYYGVYLTGTETAYTGTFTATSEDLYIAMYVTSTGTTGTMTISDVQLELGSTATTYEPYTGSTYPISWQTEAGTVYGGTLTVNEDGSGELVVDRKYMLCNSVNDWDVSSSNTVNFEYRNHQCTDRKTYSDSFSGLSCSYMTVDATQATTQTARWMGASSYAFGLRWVDGTIDQVKADAVAGKIAIVYELATPVTYQLTDLEVIETLKGLNNIWADTGDVSVSYRADTKRYVDDAIPSVPVQDVQVNGTSVLSQGVANVPVAGTSNLGAVKVNYLNGVGLMNDLQTLGVSPADSNQIKSGTELRRPISPIRQHDAVYYALAKLAGADMASLSGETVGVYPEAQRSAISQMLDAPETVSGTTPSITAKPGVRYVCGECATLTIVAPASGCIDVTFTSGSTATVLTVSSAKTGVTAIKWEGGFDPTSLDANTTYEVNILDGEFGVVGKWT